MAGNAYYNGSSNGWPQQGGQQGQYGVPAQQAAYPPQSYPDPRSQPQSYMPSQQYPGGYPPPAMNQRTVNQQVTQQYPPQGNSMSQSYGQDYNPQTDSTGGEESSRGIGTHVVGAIGGRKAAKKMDLGPVAVLAAGFVGAKMLSKAADKRKDKH